MESIPFGVIISVMCVLRPSSSILGKQEPLPPGTNGSLSEVLMEPLESLGPEAVGVAPIQGMCLCTCVLLYHLPIFLYTATLRITHIRVKTDERPTSTRVKADERPTSTSCNRSTRSSSSHISKARLSSAQGSEHLLHLVQITNNNKIA
uniref:Uncharacterized protein n=1 Tax=Glossina austeni TaxID=7395 RepID=A0A1A9UTP4_GLOAU